MIRACVARGRMFVECHRAPEQVGEQEAAHVADVGGAI